MGGGGSGAWRRREGVEKRQEEKRGRKMCKYTNRMIWSDGSHIIRGVELA